MKVHNLMEDVVSSCLKDLVARQNRYQVLNERALADVMAIALNQLPPRYVATERGEVIAKSQLRQQVESDVYRELTKALERVMQSPRNR